MYTYVPGGRTTRDTSARRRAAEDAKPLKGLAAADGFEIVTGSAYLVRRKRESRNRRAGDGASRNANANDTIRYSHTNRVHYI